MHLQDWTLLDAFQAGALFALAAAYGADSLARRDRMMGWMAFACLLLGLHHALMPSWGALADGSDPMSRAQILLVSAGFLALSTAIVHLFPRHMPGRFPLWIAVGLLPNLVRSLLLRAGHPLEPVLGHATDLVYLTGCAVMIRAALKARMAGDPMGGRFFLGFVVAAFPVVVEIAASSLFNLRIHLSGLSMMVLATVIGSSWQWLATQSLRERVLETEGEAEAWRNLVPGTTFRTDRSSPFMETTFGPSWAERIRYEGVDHLVSRDGTPYRLQQHALPRHHALGAVSREDETRPGLGGFLGGWTVGLGMDPTPEASRVEAWLRAWGADIEVWSTVPPREGPYPSVLIWAREPSILSVWREDDLLRRRARWIQVGGPQTDGPHARLDPPLTESSLRAALKDLLGPIQER
ncbi:MAG TPA: hypothetical protein VF768_00345 [Holophagaceae bacterium]